jgi:hypothetical protein
LEDILVAELVLAGPRRVADGTAGAALAMLLRHIRQGSSACCSATSVVVEFIAVQAFSYGGRITPWPSRPIASAVLEKETRVHGGDVHDRRQATVVPFGTRDQLHAWWVYLLVLVVGV